MGGEGGERRGVGWSRRLSSPIVPTSFDAASGRPKCVKKDVHLLFMSGVVADGRGVVMTALAGLSRRAGGKLGTRSRVIFFLQHVSHVYLIAVRQCY